MTPSSYSSPKGQFVRSNEWCKPACRSQIAGHCDTCFGTGFKYVRKDIMDTSILKNIDTSRFTLDEVMELECAANMLSQHYASHEIDLPPWLGEANRKLLVAVVEKNKLRLIEKEKAMQAEIDDLMPKDEKRKKLKQELAALRKKNGPGTAA